MENLPAIPILVLAQSAMSENTLAADQLSPLGWSAVALAVGAVALALLAAMIASWMLSAAAQRDMNNPRRLLTELCLAHGIPRRQQRTLATAAGVLGVQQPARLFLEPDLLRQAAEHPRLRARRREILEIRGELFEPAI